MPTPLARGTWNTIQPKKSNLESHAEFKRSDGALFAWGYNGQGQLGDGTHVNRPLPIRVFQTPQPTLNPDGGTYTSITHVQCNNPVEGGAEMHYALNSEEPTQDDPAIGAGQAIPVFHPTSLKVKAWKNGYLPSLTKTSSYDVQVTEENSGDSDDDGLPDLWEYQHFGSTSVDPNADSDADGFLNYQEHHNGTDPNQIDPGAEQPTPVEGLEAIQRGLQKRYQAVDSRHQTLVFPTRSDGTAPPPLPPDGFYAMDSTNTVRMVALVQHLSDKLHDVEFLRRFVSADRGDLEDAKSLPVHGPATMPALPPVTAENYLDNLTEIGVRLAKLRHPWMGSFNTVDPSPLWHTGEWVGLEYKGGWHYNSAMHSYPAGTFESSEAFGQEVTAEVAEARSAIIAEADNAQSASWQPHTQRQSYGGLLSQFLPGAQEYLFVSSGPSDYYNDGSGFAQVDARAEKSAVRGKLQFDLSPFAGPVQLYISSKGWGGLTGPVALDQRLHKLEENEAGQVYTSNYIGDFETLPWLPAVLEGQGNSASWQLIHWVAVLTDDFAEPKVKIALDANRDGEIELNGQADKTSSDQPFRFWVNDDDDVGETADTAGDDAPGQAPSTNQSVLGDNEGADYRTLQGEGRVDGVRDLVDFFPVVLDFGKTLDILPPGNGVEYRLRQDDGALNLVYTGLRVSEAMQYLTQAFGSGFGRDNAQKPTEAETIPITGSGVPLNENFLNIVKANGGKAVLLMEVAKESNKQLILEVIKDGQPIASSEVHLSVSGVEKMYRWINLRDKAGDAVARPTEVSEPSNYPDNQTNGKHFIWVHGYNVNEHEARGSVSEMYKRLYWSGSKTMFTGVTWYGDQSQVWAGVPFAGGAAPDYYEDIKNAFTTAPFVKIEVTGLPGQKFIAAHSLGNMVVSSAIKDHGLNVTQYFMLDAAVAIEAYDASVSHANQMENPDWTDYEHRLWASEWHQLFSPERGFADDGRYKLTWRNRFGAIANAYNFYSSGEDVLQNSNGIVPAPNSRERAWANQEMRKGTTLIDVITWDGHGGWGFNPYRFVPLRDENGIPILDQNQQLVYVRKQPAEAALLTDDELRQDSFFKRIRKNELYGESGSSVAADPIVRAMCLAECIPSLTFALGRNEVGSFGVVRNVDLMTMRTGWPQERIQNPDKQNRWLHSDWKAIPYFYTHPLFEKFVEIGGLKQ